LTIGIPGENLGNLFAVGAVNFLNGSDNGLTPENSQIWFQDQPGAEGSSENGDRFESSLA